MKKKLEFIVEQEDTLKNVVLQKIGKKFYKKLRFSGEIYVNEKITRRDELVYNGDLISIFYEENNEDCWPVINKMPKVIYEDKHYLVVYKEANLLTIPTKAEPISLYQMLKFYLGPNGHVSILNRLDKETSGLLMVAKDRLSANLLSPVKEHIKRKYYALVEGIVEKDGMINSKISKSKDSNLRIISDNGKEAMTFYKVLKHIGGNTLLEVTLLTGRTHQIRVHLKSIKHPIIGDVLYGGKSYKRMCLESYFLSFYCPYEKKLNEFMIECDFDEKNI